MNEIKSISKISSLSESFSGNINTTVFINYSAVEKEKIKFNLLGKISKFNLINNNEFPITLQKFNGDLKFKNNILEINGNAFLNNSKSDIDIKIDKNYKLLINVSSSAIFSSFDFLKDYNFIESGTSKLKLKIEKENLYYDKWKAYLSANLYNNQVKINEVVYEKNEKDQGLLEAEFNFENLTLKNVKNLTFIADDILIRGDISLGNSGEINQIKVHEFKRQLDDFSANIILQENDYFTLDVSGKSININNFFSESDNNTLSGKVNILVENLFLII